MIMLTRSSEGIFNPMCYTGLPNALSNNTSKHTIGQLTELTNIHRSVTSRAAVITADTVQSISGLIFVVAVR